MSLTKSSLPNCCSAYFLSGLSPAMYKGSTYGTIKDIEKNLKEKLKTALGNQTSIFLITSKSQKETMRLLRQMGWECSPWLERHGVFKKSTYNKIKMWWFRLTPERVKLALALDYKPKEKIFESYDEYTLYIRKNSALQVIKNTKIHNKKYPNDKIKLPEYDENWHRIYKKR